MRAILRQLEKFFPLLKNTALPALIFMIALLAFYGFQPMPVHTLHLLHGSFFVLAFLSVLVMLYFNRSRPVFTLLVMTLAYIVINLPVGYLLAFTLGLGPGGLWMGFILGLSIAAVQLITRFRRQYRRLAERGSM